jgi:hypothetical protein
MNVRTHETERAVLSAINSPQARQTGDGLVGPGWHD